MKALLVMLFMSVVGGIIALGGYSILQRAWRRRHLKDYIPPEKNSQSNVRTAKSNAPATNLRRFPVLVRESTNEVDETDEQEAQPIGDLAAMRQRRRNESQACVSGRR